MTATRHILYISSDHPLSRTRRMVLERAGYTVSFAEDAETAVRALRDYPVFLVIIGVMIDPEAPVEIIAALRREPSAPLFLSVAGVEQYDVDYALPPCGPEELLAAVGKALIRSHGHTAPDDDFYMFVDSDRRYIHVTDAAAELLAYKRGELIGRSIEEIAAAQMPVEEKFEEYVRDGVQTGAFQLRRSDNQVITVAYHAEVLPDGCMVSHLFPLKTPVGSEPQPVELRKIRPNHS